MAHVPTAFENTSTLCALVFYWMSYWGIYQDTNMYTAICRPFFFQDGIKGIGGGEDG